MSGLRQADHEIEVVTPYRLDLTVSVLRRSSSNILDLFTRDREYRRVLPVGRGSLTAFVWQASASSLAARFEGSGNRQEALAGLRRGLGVDRDTSRFERTARRIPWLRGRFDEMRDDAIRSAGSRGSKLATLRRVAGALRSGLLDQARLEALPSPEAIAMLRGIKGIGPWTAAVILLRGLGRLDVFPMNDSSVQQNVALVAGSAPVAIGDALDLVGEECGMLDYYLLLARLEARGEIGRVSSVFSD